MTPLRRVQMFFAVQFLSVGMINAYGGIWFAEIGLTPVQIGIIGAAPIGLLLLLTVFVGRVADRAPDWRQVIIWGMTIAGLAPIGLFWADGFWGVLLFWTILATAQRISVPVADAAALRMARREGGDFGRMRALGTIGYLSVIIVAGYILKDGSVEMFLPLFVAFGLIRSVVAFGLPNMRGPRTTEGPPTQLFAGMQVWFILPLFAYALINTNHIILNSFQGLLWKQQGIPTQVIGLLIALGAFSETLMFFYFRRVSRRFRPLTILMASAVFSVIRWAAMAASPGVAILIVLQMMHALTYAMGFLAITNFIADNTSEDNAAEAQSFLVMIELAVSVVLLIGFGWLAGQVGALAYLGSAVLAGFGWIAIVLARRLKSTALES